MVNFEELASGEIGENKFVVISRRTDGLISVAQRAEAMVGDRPMSIYMKGAVTIDDAGFREYVATVLKAASELGLDLTVMLDEEGIGG